MPGFFETAAQLFADVGFEAATMQAIADRSGSSIGALYNYFPDTQSVAAILLATYPEKLRASLESLMAESENLSAPSLPDRSWTASPALRTSGPPG
ncbi:MAG: helix-turn-helix domain-containing protein [Silvibacterium sp.]